MANNNSRAPRKDSLMVDPVLRPGWITGLERLPEPGEEVYCTQGQAQVVKLLGKTAGSGRLIELKLADQRSPFFAAASNILVPPTKQL